MLLEKADLPRYKRCGGGLIGPAQQLLADFGVDVAGLSRDHVGRVSFTNQGKGLVSHRTDPFLPMVLRSELDHQLVQIAEAAGVSVLSGHDGRRLPGGRRRRRPRHLPRPDQSRVGGRR